MVVRSLPAVMLNQGDQCGKQLTVTSRAQQLKSFPSTRIQQCTSPGSESKMWANIKVIRSLQVGWKVN